MKLCVIKRFIMMLLLKDAAEMKTLTSYRGNQLSDWTDSSSEKGVSCVLSCLSDLSAMLRAAKPDRPVAHCQRGFLLSHMHVGVGWGKKHLEGGG